MPNATVVGVGQRLRSALAGLERAHDRRAAGGLHRDQPGQRAVDPAELAQLEQRLVDADEADAAAGRVDDHVGHLPAELLDDLEAHRLLALDPVGLLAASTTSNQPSARRRPPPTSAPASPISPSTRCSSAPAATHSRRVISGASTGIAIVARIPARAAYVAQAAPALPLVGIASRVTPSSRGPGHADRGAAGLERAGRDQPLVLDQQSRHAELARRSGAAAAAASCPRPGSRRARRRAPAAARGSATGRAARPAISSG